MKLKTDNEKKILLVGSMPPPIAGQPITFNALIAVLPYNKIIIDQTN